MPASSRLRLLAPLLAVIGLILLVALPRLTALNQYIIVDESDRWRWAKDFVAALAQGDLAATRVGDGYPGIVPVWAESLWILLEAARRSLLEGRWIGQDGLYLLFHQWDRSEFLFQQRLPIVLLNLVLILLIIWAVWRLFGRSAALVSGILLALDPFYLSDSRVNRAEAVITGLMTLSILCLIFYHRQRRLRYLILSGLLGGLSFLTKIQALALLPAIVLIEIIGSREYGLENKKKSYSLLPTAYPLLKIGLVWAAAAALTWLLLWPSMWVIPLDTLNLVYEYTTRKVGAEGVNLFFMGQTYANADPGFIFYPFVFLIRSTPLVLLGLLGAALRFTGRTRFLGVYVFPRFTRRPPLAPAVRTDPFAPGGSFILVIFILTYALIMTLGSHKQDRYLLPIFPSLDILAGLGLLYLYHWLKSQIEARKNLTPYSLLPTPWLGLTFLAILILLQLLTVLPHHPYYYSYFNPLLGGGQTAVDTMRIGWGEGMDQVGAYLAAKPNSAELVVASRFTHNITDFKGELISLGLNGRWTQADYIVLYIQQVQRRQEPSPAFIDYFQTRPPEKTITIGGIDYAWIYPRPFTIPANPEISLIPGQAALLGYRWELKKGESANGENLTVESPSIQPLIRLFWENQGLSADHQLAARLINPTAQTDWAICRPGPAFEAQASTPGAFVESLCAPDLTELPPGLYTVEVGLLPGTSPVGTNGYSPLPFVFPEGHLAATLTPAGQISDTLASTRLEALVDAAVPPDAIRLERVYEGRLRLVAYQLDPPAPQPGQPVRLTLYWQPVKELPEPLRLTVQLADSRRLPLGRSDDDLPAPQWLLGQVIPTEHTFTLPADLDAPLAGWIEVTLQNQTEVNLPATTPTGSHLESNLAGFTIAPAKWPPLPQVNPTVAAWENEITLAGYTLAPQPARPGETLSVGLYWQPGQPVAENYVVFVHLLDQAGQLKAQNDDLPRAGAYPTPWWRPGDVIEDIHPLTLPADLPPGTYQLAVGLYRRDDDVRLPLMPGGDSFILGAVEVK